MRFLEIGPGETRLGPEWETVDCRQRPGVDRVGVWGEHQALNYMDCTFDLVYASHVLEHVPWFQTATALKDVHRILKHSGAFEVWVPNFEYLVQCYLRRRCGDDWRKFNDESDPMLWLNGRLFTYGGPDGLDDPNWHRAVFDERSLQDHLYDAGFKLIERIDGKENPRGHDHGPINLGMRALK